MLRQGGSTPVRAAAMAESQTSGYTLPVWVAAAARAALAVAQGEAPPAQVCLDLDPAQHLPVRAVAPLDQGWVLAETCCDPGDGLDLTRGLLVWVMARLEPLPLLPAPSGIPPSASPLLVGMGLQASAAGESSDPDRPLWDPAPRRLQPRPLLLAPALLLEAGVGVGLQASRAEPCLSTFARRLLCRSLLPHLPPGQGLRLRLQFPAGEALAERTSNAAFGVVQGLALIGTQAQVQASAAPDQLEASLAALRQQCAAPAFAGSLLLVIGENGRDLAAQLGVDGARVVKAGNWLGPLLVAAAETGVAELLLLGYQGKLLKLAAGIFHTHHHLADGRAEVLTALAALEGLTGAPLQRLHEAATVEDALADLEQQDAALAGRLRHRLAARIEERSTAYLHRHGVPPMRVGAALFDRRRRIRVVGPIGGPLLRRLAPGAVAEPAFAGMPDSGGGGT